MGLVRGAAAVLFGAVAVAGVPVNQGLNGIAVDKTGASGVPPPSAAHFDAHRMADEVMTFIAHRPKEFKSEMIDELIKSMVELHKKIPGRETIDKEKEHDRLMELSNEELRQEFASVGSLYLNHFSVEHNREMIQREKEKHKYEEDPSRFLEVERQKLEAILSLDHLDNIGTDKNIEHLEHEHEFLERVVANELKKYEKKIKKLKKQYPTDSAEFMYAEAALQKEHQDEMEKSVTIVHSLDRARHQAFKAHEVDRQWLRDAEMNTLSHAEKADMLVEITGRHNERIKHLTVPGSVEHFEHLRTAFDLPPLEEGELVLHGDDDDVAEDVDEEPIDQSTMDKIRQLNPIGIFTFLDKNQDGVLSTSEVEEMFLEEARTMYENSGLDRDRRIKEEQLWAREYIFDNVDKNNDMVISKTELVDWLATGDDQGARSWRYHADSNEIDNDDIVNREAEILSKFGQEEGGDKLW